MQRYFSEQTQQQWMHSLVNALVASNAAELQGADASTQMLVNR